MNDTLKQVLIAALSSALITGLLGGLTVWRQMGVLEERMVALNSAVTIVAADHEARIRDIVVVNHEQDLKLVQLADRADTLEANKPK